ncbi:MAG TPA: hypothetical protein VMK12_08670 [Anaeromyxobacteraceae bacterium]|nr:hypothetical protein [Anaeromyxobacteraceae bacterium]
MRRWLQLALFASDDQRGLDNPLLDAAAVRATFMDRLACSLQPIGKGAIAQELLDALYDVSMRELVRVLNLLEEVSTALLERSGVLGTPARRYRADGAPRDRGGVGPAQRVGDRSRASFGSAAAWRST